MVRVRVVIRNRSGVFDPVGKVVEGGLQRLGHNVENVRVGKVIELDVPGTDRAEIHAQVDEMCRQFLVNALLEEWVVEMPGGEA